MKFSIKNLALVVAFCTFSSSFAADLEEGQSLYEADCTSCHDSKVFTRKDRKINDLAALKKQVHRCVAASEASWFEEDEENAVAYISETFYKFAKKEEAKKEAKKEIKAETKK